MITIPIDIARPRHAYDIVLAPGLGRDWRGVVEERFPGATYLAAIDGNLAELLSLPASGAREGGWRYLRVAAGEPNKTLAQYAGLCEQALGLGVDRDTVVVALGGGVVGDIAGFVAATLLRGLRLAQIPTTLLAQVDSSVGGKNGVNAAAGKNMVGTFHQPSLVLIDPQFLDTLPRREYLAGVAEIAKTAVLAGGDFFAALRRDARRLLATDHEALADTVARACRFKAGVVQDDELDRGRRALLNLGHTFGHALESAAGYDGTVIHGEAVAVGVALAAEFSLQCGWLGRDGRDAIVSLLEELEQPVHIADLGKAATVRPDWPALLSRDALSAALLGDKKSGGGKVNLVLSHGIGDCRVDKGFAAAEVADFMLSRL